MADDIHDVLGLSGSSLMRFCSRLIRSHSMYRGPLALVISSRRRIRSCREYLISLMYSTTIRARLRVAIILAVKESGSIVDLQHGKLVGSDKAIKGILTEMPRAATYK